MAAAAMILNNKGQLRATPEQVIQTPSVIAILVVIALIDFAILFGIIAYWHAVEAAKKLHPGSVGYGHWYFSGFIRVVLSAVAAGWLLLSLILTVVVIWLVPGPMLAEARIREQGKASQTKVLDNLEQTAISIAQSRAIAAHVGQQRPDSSHYI